MVPDGYVYPPGMISLRCSEASGPPSLQTPYPFGSYSETFRRLKRSIVPEKVVAGLIVFLVVVTTVESIGYPATGVSLLLLPHPTLRVPREIQATVPAEYLIKSRRVLAAYLYVFALFRILVRHTIPLSILIVACSKRFHFPKYEVRDYLQIHIHDQKGLSNSFLSATWMISSSWRNLAGT